MTAPRPSKAKRTTPSRVSRPQASREEASLAEREPAVTLIVGTDTGVGKTFITSALARAVRAAGQPVVAVKPIETGCDGEPDPNEDGMRLAAATGQTGPLRALVRLPGALAPAIAADQAGVVIDYDDLVARIRSLAAPGTILLVEGAVAADRLGTLSHTLMALRVLAAERVPVLGVVLNQPGEADDSTRTNAGALLRLAEQVPVVSVPRLADDLQAAEALKEVAGWILP